MSVETQAERDAADCTVCYCGKCERVQMAIVTAFIEKVKGQAAEIGALVAHGSTVKHMPASEARDQLWGCKCA